jgi:hypothetical protein
MRYHILSVLRLSVLAAMLLASLATPLPSPWGEMLVKHKWVYVPDKWVTLGHPPNGTTIDIHIVLKPKRENALIDVLQEISQPRHPKHVIFTTSLFEAYSCVLLLVSDMVHISPKSKLLSLSALGSDTTGCRPPPFR